MTQQINNAISNIPLAQTLAGPLAKVITSENDFGQPVNGEILLEGSTDYIIEGKVTITYPLVVNGDGVTIRGAGTSGELFFDESGAQKNLFIRCLDYSLNLWDLTLRGGGGNYVEGTPGFQITIPFLNLGNITSDPITDPEAANGRNKTLTIRGCTITQQKELSTIAGFREIKVINNRFVGSDIPSSTLRTVGSLRFSQTRSVRISGNTFEKWDSSISQARYMLYVGGNSGGAAISSLTITDNTFEAEELDYPLIIVPDARILGGTISGNNFKLGTAVTPAINYFKYELGTKGHVSVRNLDISNNTGVRDMKTSLTSVLERGVEEYQPVGNTWTAIDIKSDNQTKFLPSNDFGMLLRVSAGGTGTTIPTTNPFLEAGNVLTSTSTGQNLTIMEDVVLPSVPTDSWSVWVHDLSLGNEWVGGDIEEYEPNGTPTGYTTNDYDLTPTFKYLGKESVTCLAVVCASVRWTGDEKKDVRTFLRLAYRRDNQPWTGIGTSVSRNCEKQEETDNLTIVTSVTLHPGDLLRAETRTGDSSEEVAVEYLNFNISV